MLAPVPKKRKDGGSSFKSLGAYLTNDVDKETGEVIQRGEIMLSPSLLSEETAAIEMRAVSKENQRCKDPVLHLVLSWQKDENPSREQWEKAVNHAMKELGMTEHQYMAVAHTDTENFHVHIMANRVHPETYRAHYPEWLHKSLDKACREIEAEQGWQHSNGLYKWDEDKGRAVPMTRAEREALREAAERRELEAGEAGKDKAAKMERFGNAESLQTYCKGAPAQELAAVMKQERATWQDVHAVMARHGLELHKGEKGGYTVTAGAGVKVKASDVFRRQFSGKAVREATEGKLGEWEPPRQKAAEPVQTYNPHREPKRNPAQRAERRDERAAAREDLKARYRDYKATYYQDKAKRRPAEQAAAKARYAELAKDARERRAAIRTEASSPAERKALQSVAAAEAVQAKERLRAELAEMRRADRPQDLPGMGDGASRRGRRRRDQPAKGLALHRAAPAARRRARAGSRRTQAPAARNRRRPGRPRPGRPAQGARRRGYDVACRYPNRQRGLSGRWPASLHRPRPGIDHRRRGPPRFGGRLARGRREVPGFPRPARFRRIQGAHGRDCRRCWLARGLQRCRPE